ncbi:MAG: putative peptidylprolyl isomerase [Erysipelotrichaceae bacterium]|nr:MAG: putative peptidylprolyl [Erysipelotrichaceae bacterium]TXT18764.1 MAG: putative peptidylprolyl isomerase [Erysipelotrichaceae bacterium]
MKKLLVLALAVFLLGGCFDKTTSISDKKTVLITLDNATITKGDVYDVMGKVEPYPAVVVLTLSKKMILAKEVGLTAEVKAAADAELAAFLEKNKADLQKGLDDAGFKTKEELYDEKLIVEAQSDVLVSKYLDTTYTTIVSTYKPMKARVMEIEKKTDATAALAAIKAGTSFTTVADQYGNDEYPSDLKIYYTGSDLPELVLTFLKGQTLPTLSTVIEDATNELYYIVQVSVADGNAMKNEVIINFKKDATFVQLALLGYYDSNEFKIYDRTIYDMIETNYPDYIIQ